MMKASDIREKFLSYFESKGHARVESSSLVPQNDPTLLFTNAGMNQFKDVFLGTDRRDYQRATTAQRCVRAGGKHNDLENVGYTARHHTMFEMMGNFSFGDYFKEDAIKFAWEFLTQELGIPESKLYPTVFRDDDEAFGIWENTIGVPKEKIYRFGEKDNFWEMGETGPCGPCSEIFFDRGEKYDDGTPDTQMGGEGDRFVEIWNLVFMQYNRDKSGKLNPLAAPSIDTGAGLERLAMALQECETNYETDIFQEIIRTVESISGKKYKDNLTSFRVIADHARATAFLVADGVLPSNEGRGYVLRRIVRRAVRHGRKLGFDKPFLFKTCEAVIDQMQSAYSYLSGQRDFVLKAVEAEEEQFLKTLARGLDLLEDEFKKLGQGKTLDGEIAFKLYDTYGFPIDLTRVICEERGFKVDEDGFEKAMERQKSESRKHWKGSGDAAVDGIYHEIASRLRAGSGLPEFTGYDSLIDDGECIALLKQESPDNPPAEVKSVTSGKALAVFSRTPFYGESGGQVGDQGRVTGNGLEAKVTDVQKPVSDLIVAHLDITKGSVEVGKTYTQETDRALREASARNHTATHLLHWALREVLGKHVKQAGSLVNEDLLRFDFTHFQAMTTEELEQVESLINQKVWNNDGVQKQVMTKDKALESGAIAMFGEKYGEEVRVVSVGDYSVEFCGGTHVNQSSDIHLFKIGAESGIAAGVRRIIAYTSKGAFDFLKGYGSLLNEAAGHLKVKSVDEVPARVEKLVEAERVARKEVEKLSSKLAGAELDEFINQAKNVEGGKLVVGLCRPDDGGMKKLREMADQVRAKVGDATVVLGIESPAAKKAFILAARGKGVKGGPDAKTIISKISPHIDGRGGGKPDLAQAGGTKPAGLSHALDEVASLF
jgi:alanyl-tRNA synthetase